MLALQAVTAILPLLKFVSIAIVHLTLHHFVGAFNSFQKKIQSPKMLATLTFILQVNGIGLGFGSNVISLLAGKFEAEFLRVAIKASVAMFTFYSDSHWLVRFIVSAKLVYF